jgi:site-specific DNA-cytosine methylase
LKNADINADILQWNYKQFKPNDFNIIWASPPCIEYSRAKTTGIRKIDYANSIVKKTIEIINYFNPSVWFIENPQTGLLKQQDFMIDFDYYDIDYCKYGMEYRKRTRIWTNLKDWTPRPLCKKDCGNIMNHKQQTQRNSTTPTVKGKMVRTEETHTRRTLQNTKRFNQSYFSSYIVDVILIVNIYSNST